MYKKGFAHTNNIINGGLECRTTSSTAFTEKVVLRSELYKYYLDIMGFSATEIIEEDSGEYSTLCYQSNTMAMEDYANCQNNTLSVNNFDDNKFTISPNPVINKVNISNTHSIQKIEIYNITGQKLAELTPNTNTTTFNMSALNKGFYIIVITSQNKHSISKLIKQ